MNTVAKNMHSQSPALELELELGSEPELKHAGARESGSSTVTGSLTQRVDAIDWFDVEEELNGYGCAMLRNLLSAQECDALTAIYPRDDLYRSRVVMARHGFGRGEYKYFAYPLPQLVAKLRAELYPRLAPVANRWNEAMNIDVRYPAAHGEFIERCHAAGQLRPTPLILQYTKDDYNCLHQDLYGEHVFPLQVAILLSEPGQDFTGGEFVMTEQRPRMQTRTEVVPLGKGDAVVFAVHHRPVQGTRGVYRVNLRHGVSRLRSGHRYTLGVIFHDAT
ncbi:2OG-Fe(II) oxygenase [Paraburkholderia sediminicola]|uniref:2OG-Fe(II) oxygenase n=1 Tax=Paraburkholderia sediminicola TaxID=458836 RepID=UPI0038BA139C